MLTLTLTASRCFSGGVVVITTPPPPTLHPHFHPLTSKSLLLLGFSYRRVGSYRRGDLLLSPPPHPSPSLPPLFLIPPLPFYSRVGSHRRGDHLETADWKSLSIR